MQDDDMTPQEDDDMTPQEDDDMTPQELRRALQAALQQGQRLAAALEQAEQRSAAALEAGYRLLASWAATVGTTFIDDVNALRIFAQRDPCPTELDLTLECIRGDNTRGSQSSASTLGSEYSDMSANYLLDMSANYLFGNVPFDLSCRMQGISSANGIVLNNVCSTALDDILRQLGVFELFQAELNAEDASTVSHLAQAEQLFAFRRDWSECQIGSILFRIFGLLRNDVRKEEMLVLSLDEKNVYWGKVDFLFGNRDAAGNVTGMICVELKRTCNVDRNSFAQLALYICACSGRMSGSWDHMASVNRQPVIGVLLDCSGSFRVLALVGNQFLLSEVFSEDNRFEKLVRLLRIVYHPPLAKTDPSEPVALVQVKPKGSKRIRDTSETDHRDAQPQSSSWTPTDRIPTFIEQPAGRQSMIEIVGHMPKRGVNISRFVWCDGDTAGACEDAVQQEKIVAWLKT